MGSLAPTPGSKIQIFISYSHRDGVELATKLYDDLNRQADCDAWLDTRRLRPGASWSREIEREIDSRDALLALLSHGSYRSEICRAEQLRALRRGKRVIPLLLQPDADRPLHLEPRQYLDFTRRRQYPDAFQELLADLRQPPRRVELEPRFRATYVTAPPLPPNYVERPEVLASLRARLIRDGDALPIGITALRGMGGIGKTVLAQALCHDEVVRQAFPDGVLWVIAGREPAADLATRMSDSGRTRDAAGPSSAQIARRAASRRAPFQDPPGVAAAARRPARCSQKRL